MRRELSTVAPSGRRTKLGLLISSHLVDDLYQGAVPVLLPFFAAERGYTGLAAGGLTFAATFLSSAVQPAFGWFSDRNRMRWLIGLGLLIAGIGIGLSGLVDNYAVTWLLIMLTGLGVAAYHPEATRGVREVGGGSTQVMSWFSVGGNAGVALAPVVITPILGMTGLVGTPLFTIPALFMAGTLVLARHSPHRRVPETAQSAAAAPGSTGTDDWIRMGWLVGVVVLRSGAYLGLATFLVLYLTQEFGAPTSAAAPALTVFTASGACGTLLGGWLADRWSRVGALRLGYAVATAGTLVIALSSNVVLVYAGCVVAGVGLYLPFAIHTTLGQDYLPTRLATASGITTGLAISAGGLFTPFLGMLSDAYGQRAALGVLVVFPLLALALATQLREHTRLAGRQRQCTPAR